MLRVEWPIVQIRIHQISFQPSCRETARGQRRRRSRVAARALELGSPVFSSSTLMAPSGRRIEAVERASAESSEKRRDGPKMELRRAPRQLERLDGNRLRRTAPDIRLVPPARRASSVSPASASSSSLSRRASSSEILGAISVPRARCRNARTVDAPACPSRLPLPCSTAFP